MLLFYQFRQDELKQIFERLGYSYTPETLRKTVAYYDARTSHGSTLSFVAYAGIYSEIDLAISWERYMVALESDVGDVQGGTTAEGIHMGVMSGTLDLVQRSYVGEMIRDGVLYFNPKAMNHLRGLILPMRFRGLLIEVTLEDGRLRVSAEVDSLNRSVKLGVGDQVREIRSGRATPSTSERDPGSGEVHQAPAKSYAGFFANLPHKRFACEAIPRSLWYPTKKKLPLCPWLFPKE